MFQLLLARWVHEGLSRRGIPSEPEADIGNGAQHFGGADDCNADFPVIHFSGFAGAAFVRRRGTFIAALRPMSPDRPLKASLRPDIQTVLSLQPRSTIEERTQPTFVFPPSLTQHPLAGAARFSLRCGRSRQTGH